MTLRLPRLTRQRWRPRRAQPGDGFYPPTWSTRWTSPLPLLQSGYRRFGLLRLRPHRRANRLRVAGLRSAERTALLPQHADRCAIEWLEADVRRPRTPCKKG